MHKYYQQWNSRLAAEWQVINNSWGDSFNVEGRWKDSSPFDPKYVITMPVLTVFMSDGFFDFYGNYFNGVRSLMTDADVIQVFAAGNEGWNSETGLVRVDPKFYYSDDSFAYGFPFLKSVDYIINNFIPDNYDAFADLAGLDKNGTSGRRLPPSKLRITYWQMAGSRSHR